MTEKGVTHLQQSKTKAYMAKMAALDKCLEECQALRQAVPSDPVVEDFRKLGLKSDALDDLYRAASDLAQALICLSDTREEARQHYQNQLDEYADRMD